MNAFNTLPLDEQIFLVVTIGTAVIVGLIVVFFIVPELWQLGREAFVDWLKPDPDEPQPTVEERDARMVRGGDATDPLPPPRSQLDAVCRLGSQTDVPRVRGLSERVSGLRPAGHAPYGNGRPSAAKGFKR